MTNKNCGIYKITNTITGKFYIGSAVNIKKRWNRHRSDLVNNTHCNRYLQNSWNKHGEQAFVFEIILLCDIKNKLYYEQVFLDTLKPAYNIAINSTAPTQGLTLSEEARRKLSEAHKGRVHTEEAKRKMSEATKGRPPVTEEVRRKLSEALTGDKHPNFGKHLTEEAKRKMSEANKGRVHTEEAKRKMSEAQKNRPPITEETKRKMSEANKGEKNPNFGKHHTEETRRKMSEARKAYYAERKAATITQTTISQTLDIRTTQ